MKLSFPLILLLASAAIGQDVSYPAPLTLSEIIAKAGEKIAKAAKDKPPVAPLPTVEETTTVVVEKVTERSSTFRDFPDDVKVTPYDLFRASDAIGDTSEQKFMRELARAIEAARRAGDTATFEKLSAQYLALCEDPLQ